MNPFDAQAKDFDTQRRIDRAQKIAQRIRQNASPGGHAMEYGCGTGLVGFALTGHFASITFADSSPGMIRQVEAKIAQGGHRNARALLCDLAQEPLQDGLYDCIFSSMALHHIADVSLVFERMRGLLAKSGKLLIVDLAPDDGAFHADEPGFMGHNGFAQDEICAWALEAGFRAARAETFYRDVRPMRDSPVPYSLFLMEALL